MNRRHRPVLEELEPRILFSADLAALTGAHLLDAAEVRQLAPTTTSSAAIPAENTQAQAVRREIVFVDTSVEHWETLVGDIEATAGKRNLDVVLIDASRDGIDQVSTVLANRQGIDAIHIISHGSAGMLQLGATQLDASALAARATQIQGWQSALGSEADILLYGCDVAGTADGQAFIARLGQLTGADIAASSDKTGNAAQGGNWQFEYKFGAIEAQSIAGTAEPTQWSGTLVITSNGTDSTQTINATGLSWLHTVNAGSDRVMVVELAIDNVGLSVSSVTYGGTALTQIGRGTGNHAVELWALINPNVGAANVVATFSGNTAAAGGASTFNGVAQTIGTAFGTFVSASGSGLSASVTVASAVGEQVVDVQYWQGAPTGGAAGAGQTIQWWQTNAAMISGSTVEAGAPSVVMSGDFTSSTQWQIGAVSMKAAPGISVTPSTGLTTTEAGGTANFSVVLDSAPTANVTIALSSSDSSEGTLSTGSLTFTTANWNTPQTVTVTGVDDSFIDGNISYSIVTATASSTDLRYNGLNASDISVSSTDNDTVNTLYVDTTSDTLDGTVTSIVNLMANKGADGKISLREAITAANNTANGAGGADRIYFNISGTGIHTINLSSLLPAITQTVIIDATTDDSFAAAGSRPAIALDGGGTVLDGLEIYSGSDGTTIRGLIIQNFTQDGIDIAYSNNNSVVGNWIGLTTNGAGAAGSGNGVNLWTTDNNIIGGNSAADRNVISGNGFSGIFIGHDNGLTATGNQITGNYIGTNAAGSAAVGNDYGIVLEGGGNTVGGSTAGTRNIVSGNTSAGIGLNSADAINNVISGNYIGTDASGLLALANGGSNVLIQNNAANNVIGGTSANTGNLIANSNVGISVIDSGTLGNAFLGNSISNSATIGIDLGGDLLHTANDAGDADSGANNLQNTPILISAVTGGGNSTLTGSLNSTANTTFRLEFFSNPAAGGGGYADGKTYLGTTTVTTDSSGDASFNTLLGGTSLTPGHAVLATATEDLGGGLYGSTSEFSSYVLATSNLAPALDASKSPALATQLEDAGIPSGAVGTLISTLLDFTTPGGQVDNVADADSGALLGIAVTAADASLGTWWYSTDDGNNWLALGSVSASNARLLAADSGTRLYLQSSNNTYGTLASAITFQSWDQTSGSNGGTADATVNGGNSAFSANSDTASLIVTPVNDAPILADSALTLTVAEDAGVPSGTVGSLVSTFTGGISDADSGAVNGIAIVASNETNGTWYYSTNGGTNWAVVGTVNSTSSLLLANDASSRLYFSPAANYSGSTTSALTLRAWDQTSGSAGAKVDTSSNGASTAFSSATDVIDITVTAVNDAPVLGFVTGASTYTENAGAVVLAPFATLSDVDSPDFSGGTMTVYFTANGQAEDRFAIRNQGAGAGQIGVAGSDVTYSGVIIGTWSGGVGAASPLLINLNANASVGAVEALARNITYQNVSDTPSTAVRSVAGYVTDGDGGTSNIASGTLNIATVNDAPTTSPVTLAAITEDSGVRLITQAQLLANAADIENDTLSASNLAIASGSGTLVDNGNGTWNYTPAANDDSAVSFSYTITDNGTSNGVADPKSIAATASLDITPVNDAPVVSSITLANLPEDSNRLITQADLLAGASDVDGDALTAINLALISGNGTLADNGNGTWTFSPAANWNGAASFSFAVSDGTTTVANTASLSVTAVNDAPTLNSSVVLPGIAEDNTSNTGFPVSLIASLSTDADSGALQGIAVTAVDNANGTWQYTQDGTNWSAIGSVSQSNARLLASDATSRIRFVPNANWNGSTGLFTYQAWDQTSGIAGSTADASVNGGSTAFSFGSSGSSLSVTPVNDPPVFTSPPNIAGTQDTAYSYTISTTDPDTGAVLTITAPTLPAWLSLTDNGNGTATLSGTPANAQVGSHSVVLQVSDGTLSANQSFTLVVANVNDAPTITSNGGGATATLNAAENQTAVTTVTATDPDIGAALTYSLAGVDAALFNIDSGGVLTFNSGPNFELTADDDHNGVYEVTVQVSDGSLTDTQAISVTVTNVNEAPSSLGISNSSVAENTDTSAGHIVGNLSSSDPDSPDSATYSIVGGADAAVFSVNASQQLVLTAGLLNFEAKASYDVTLRITDAGGLSYDQALTVSVLNLNEAPSFTSTPNTAGTQDVAYSYTISTTDPDTGAALSISAPTLPAWMTLTDNGNGTATLSGTPTNAQVGSHSVALQVSDGLLSASQSFTLVVANVNDAPTVSPINLGNILEDGSRLITQTDLLAGANDTDGDVMTAINLSLTGGMGSLTDNGNGTWTFSPTANSNGNVSFSFAVSDSTTSTANAASLTVSAVNDPPVFTSTPITAGTQDVAYSYTISTTDPDTGDALTISAPTLPAWLSLTDNGNGTATLSGTPTNTQVGSHSVVLQVSDGTLSTNQNFTLVVANVNDAPTITSNGGGATAAVNAAENQTAVTTVTATDPDFGSALIYGLAGADATLFNIDSAGVLTFNSGPNFELTADANGDGIYEVTVQVSDGGLSDTQAISVTVTNINEAPTAVADAFGGNEDTTITGNVLINDSDPDGNALTAVLLSGPSHGSLSLNADGSFSYTSAADWNGSDSFSYQSSDGSLSSGLATVTLTVAPVNDAPVVSAITLANLAEDGSRLITQATLLAGATDVDGDALTAINVALTSGSGSLADNGNGTWTLTPATNWNGNGSFSFAVSDGTTTTANTASLTVTSVNDPPTTTPVTLTPIAEDSGPRLITQAELLANAADIEGDALVAGNLLIATGYGSLVDNGDGSWTYTPAANDDTSVSFSYTISDNGMTNSVAAPQTIAASANLDLTPVNDAPVSSNGTLSITEDNLASGQLPTATDVDGDPISYSLASPASHGSLIVNADSSFDYHPAQNFNGNDSFTFTVADGHGASQTYRIDIVVTPVNDAPVAADFAASTELNARLAGSLPTASDVDGDPISYALIDAAGHGIVNVASNGQFSYQPSENYDGADRFTYTVSDGQGGTSIHTATLNVRMPGAGIVIPPLPPLTVIPNGGDRSETVALPTAAPSGSPASATSNQQKLPLILLRADSGSTIGNRTDNAIETTASKTKNVAEHLATLIGTNLQRVSNDSENPELWSADVGGLDYLWKPIFRTIGGASRAGDGSVEFQPGKAGDDRDSMQWLLDVTPAKAAGVTLSVGVVWWTLRAGGLLASLAASLPVWRGIDVTMILDDRKLPPIKDNNPPEGQA